MIFQIHNVSVLNLLLATITVIAEISSFLINTIIINLPIMLQLWNSMPMICLAQKLTEDYAKWKEHIVNPPFPLMSVMDGFVALKRDGVKDRCSHLCNLIEVTSKGNYMEMHCSIQMKLRSVFSNSHPPNRKSYYLLDY